MSEKPERQFPHLYAGFIAFILVLAAAFIGRWQAERVESDYIHTLWHWDLPQRVQGSAIQLAAFRTDDILPLYGSSELAFDDEYHSERFFFFAPTGFLVLPVGKADTEPLIMLQKLAALGPDVRNKKIVISLSPSFYFEREYHARTYAGNFSELHANALAFGNSLSYELRQRIARRMLDFPDTLDKDPVLALALKGLADDTLPGRALYYFAWPLGKLHLFVLGLQDHFEVLKVIWENRGALQEIPRNPKAYNWIKLAARAETEYKERADNNPFGMDNDAYIKYREMIDGDRGISSDERFQAQVERSRGWSDLKLLLDGMQELGMRPLIILLPFKGSYWDWQGVSRTGRSVLYDQLRSTVAPYGFRTVVFDDHDEDKYFLIDPGAHLSSKGWVYYNQVLDAFYHETLK